MSERELRFAPSRELPRHMVVTVDDVRHEVSVAIYPNSKHLASRMIAWARGQKLDMCRARISGQPTLWVERASFDVTEGEAKQLAEALGLQVPPPFRGAR